MPSPFHREDPPNDSDLMDKALGAAKAAYKAVMGESGLSAASAAKNIRERKRRNREALEKSK